MFTENLKQTQKNDILKDIKKSLCRLQNFYIFENLQKNDFDFLQVAELKRYFDKFFNTLTKYVFKLKLKKKIKNIKFFNKNFYNMKFTPTKKV